MESSSVRMQYHTLPQLFRVSDHKLRRVIGVGFAFAALMIILTHLQSKYTDISPRSSEEFTVRSNLRLNVYCVALRLK